MRGERLFVQEWIATPQSSLALVLQIKMLHKEVLLFIGKESSKSLDKCNMPPQIVTVQVTVIESLFRGLRFS